MILTSCSAFRDGLDYVAEYYEKDSPITISEYNYLTEEKPQLKVKGWEDWKFDVSTEKFYMKKTFALTDFYLDQGQKFRENEERRERERYLTLR